MKFCRIWVLVFVCWSRVLSNVLIIAYSSKLTWETFCILLELETWLPFQIALSNSCFFVEFVLFHVFWTKVVSYIFITSYLSKLTAVALLYSLKSRKMITFIKSPPKIMYLSWTRVISWILGSATSSNVFITSYLSKLTAVALLYFLKCWKMITFTNSFLKIMYFCWILFISCVLSRGSFKCFQTS